MPSPGTRIGLFEVVELLGSGGMGEVYRARDTRLQREVALKLLPASVSGDPERLARFNREAQLLAALNHPHIGAIYGVEEQQDGAVLVLELVEGPTLADRIAQGPIPVDDVVSIARQIAEALEGAHEQGIIHRDLKPANIKIRADGTVKVLDFGLARTDGHGTATSDLAMSPTFTAYGTATGLILGTAAYMAPEQARGRVVDRRADIWAFGVVLFEMLTGRRPFGGDTVSEILAAIIKDEPAWTAVPVAIPGRLRELLQRTLHKDPRRRLRDIGDARLVLEDLPSGVAAAPENGPRQSSPLRFVPWALAAAATMAAVALGIRTATPRSAADLPPLKYTLPITGESLERTAIPVISPDGRTVAFVKGGSLWVRELDQLEPRPLPGTEGALYPFWSPDSRQVAYLSATSVWRIGLDGSQPARLAPYSFAKGGRTPGGVWLPDNTIVFAPAAQGSGLLSVSASEGTFGTYSKVVNPESDFHRPSVLPDGRSLVFVVDRLDTGSDTIGILANGTRKDILRLPNEALDSPAYSPTGHILYHRETNAPGIWALPFSIERLEATGPPFLVIPQASYPSIAQNGTMVYIDSGVSGMTSLSWLDVTSGTVTRAFNETFANLSWPRLSPDGTRAVAVVQTADEGNVIIVADLRRHTHVRIADHADFVTRPVWRDDRTVVFTRGHGIGERIVMRSADGSGAESTLTDGMYPHVVGDRLIFTRLMGDNGGDLFQLLLRAGTAAPGSPEVVQQQPVHEWEPALSPDGKLLAYTRGDPGQSEIVLRTFPEQRDQWQVSSSQGRNPVWSPNGDAIYYRQTAGQVMRVALTKYPSIVLGSPTLVSRPTTLRSRFGFDVSPDGSRLLMVEETSPDERRTASLAVVQNWRAAFRK